jgi:uncharacterized membrane protein
MGGAGQADQAGRTRPVVPAAALTLCAAAFLLYTGIGLTSHRSLHTNAFDLSVFDYALWTTASGGPIGYVPMFRHSLFAQHFMPTLLLLGPLASVFGTPLYLIVLQALLHAAAGLVLFCFSRRYASRAVSLALSAAFLFSRRSYSAASSFFYVESALPLLIFGALLAWSVRRAGTYWALMILALGCKEDVGLYVAVFGLVIALANGEKRLGLATAGVAALWVAVAAGIAIPYWRWLYGLDAANPFIAGRYGSASAALANLFSTTALSRLVTVASATGFACLLAPEWAVVALPGIALNLAAAPDSLQAGLIGHYLWPILPWLFAAAAVGTGRFEKAGAWRDPVKMAIVIAAVALIDSPLPRALARTAWQQPERAAEIITQLRNVPSSVSVAAQPNLIPHLARRLNLNSLGVYTAGQPDSEVVVLAAEGDLWPFNPAEIERLIATYAADPRFEEIVSGPLHVFRRR